MNNLNSISSDKQKLDYYLSLMTGDEKHEPSSISTLDVIYVLYNNILNISPNNVLDDMRDRFYLSKGHGPMAFYAVLALKGFISPDILNSYGEYDSPLGYHPDRTKLDCIEISSGSLGHGLSMSIGSILALRARKILGPTHWVLVGDAELDEGSNSEAISYAGRKHLEELNVIVIDNDSATHGWPGGIGKRFEIEGWLSSTVNGRDHDELRTAFKNIHLQVFWWRDHSNKLK